MSDDDYTCQTCHATILLISGHEIPEPDLWYCESCALDEIERLRATLSRIAAIEGCECDSYEGHVCLMCRVRAMARGEME